MNMTNCVLECVHACMLVEVCVHSLFDDLLCFCVFILTATYHYSVVLPCPLSEKDGLTWKQQDRCVNKMLVLAYLLFLQLNFLQHCWFSRHFPISLAWSLFFPHSWGSAVFLKSTNFYVFKAVQTFPQLHTQAFIDDSTLSTSAYVLCSLASCSQTTLP